MTIGLSGLIFPLADPRLAIAELARRVELSGPAVADRLQRLEAAGVIAGYRLDVSPAALGRPLGAYVRIRPGPGQVGAIIELAERTPQVVERHRVTGEALGVLSQGAQTLAFVRRMDVGESMLVDPLEVAAQAQVGSGEFGCGWWEIRTSLAEPARSGLSCWRVGFLEGASVSGGQSGSIGDSKCQRS